MKITEQLVIIFCFVSFFTSCQFGTDATQILSKEDTRKEVMNRIADDSIMQKEMMEAMIMGIDGKLMMKNNASSIKMIKDNPVLMQRMMSDVIAGCETDTAMMSAMCKKIMGNTKIMNMMQKMEGEKTRISKTSEVNTMQQRDLSSKQ